MLKKVMADRIERCVTGFGDSLLVTESRIFTRLAALRGITGREESFVTYLCPTLASGEELISIIASDDLEDDGRALFARVRTVSSCFVGR